MKPQPALMALFAAALVLAPGAVADDSTAQLDMGGLRFTHSDAIQMVSEDLYLSMSQVRVRYTFRNLTNRDVTTLVAFPLPEISPNYYYEPVEIPAPGEANFVHFRTSVDGHDVPMAIDQRAKLEGHGDVTDRVRAVGLPLSPIDPHFSDAVARMNAAARSELVHDGLLEALAPGDKTQPTEYRALWALDTAFHRSQTFPAGRTITVEQSYTPIVGASVETLLLIDSIARDNPDRRRLVRQYCVDDTFERAARRVMRQAGGAEYVQQHSLGYVLLTGANWAGPIGRFHLTIDKGAPRNLMSLCATGVRPTSPTRFELTYSSYTPRADLQVLFLTPTHPDR